MSGGVKTALIVGGVAVGAIVILKVVMPAAGVGPRTATPTSGTAATLIGLIPDAVNAGKRIFGGSSTPAGSSSDAYYKPGESYDDYTSSLFGPGINSDGTAA